MLKFERNWLKLKKKLSDSTKSKDAILLENMKIVEQMLLNYDSYDKDCQTNRVLSVKYVKGENSKVDYKHKKFVMKISIELLSKGELKESKLHSVATNIGHEYAHYYYQDPKYLGVKLKRILLEYNVFAETRADLFGRKLAVLFYGDYSFDWIKGDGLMDLNNGYLPYKKRYEIATGDNTDMNIDVVKEIISYIQDVKTSLKGIIVILPRFEKFNELSQGYQVKNKDMYDWICKLTFLNQLDLQN